MKVIPSFLTIIWILGLSLSGNISITNRQKPNMVTGTITDIRHANPEQRNKGVLGTVIVQGTSDTRVDKAELTITDDTRILAEKGITHCSALFAYLTAGHKVEARFSVPVNESYPLQATADEILVLNMQTIPPPGFAGGRPCYIADVSKCSASAQIAITHKKLPSDQIHSCEDKVVKLENGLVVTLTKISYGPGGDCPSGCIYQRYVGLFKGDEFVSDLPPDGEIGVELGIWAHPPLNQLRHPNSFMEGEVRKLYSVEVALRKGHYGWVMRIDHIEMTHVTGGPKITRRRYKYSGEIFVYLDSTGKEVWDTSGVRTEVTELL